MPSSLPVPSKAALTALRGLVVGTSCTLALIAEDRRRKINNAVRAIENGERIKSAKRYRAGGTALAIAMEEEALWDPRLGSIPGAGLELHQHDNARRTSIPNNENRGYVAPWDEADGIGVLSADAPGTGEVMVMEEAPTVSSQSIDGNLSTASLTQPHDSVEATKHTLVPPLRKLTLSPLPAPSWTWANSETVKAYTFPTADDIVVKIHEACDTRDVRKLSDVWRTVLEAMTHNLVPDNLNQRWITASAQLCRTFQEEGRIDDAAKLLYQIICRGSLRESDYLSHEPFSLIESVLARAEANKQRGDPSTAEIDTAVNLFVPKFTERPAGASPQVYNLGRKLLETCFSAERLQRVYGIYRRCILAAEGDWSELCSWFLTKLYEKQDYTSVVKIFLSTFAQSSPTEASLHAVGDIVVESVECAGDHRPEEVLRTMHNICTSLGNTKLSPKWVMRLFVSHWTKHRDFEQIERMFEELRVSGLKNIVFRHSNIYRIMVELALEAGEESKADSYFTLAVARNRALASDVRLLGVFARFHAADGDWEAVRSDFEAMNQKGTPTTQAYGQVFVPVLKAYAETHTVRETEAFLKSYTEEFKVPLCSYMVTLMAKHYAAIRDISSLIGWLDYCSQAGFPVGAAFTNAILVRCRREWKFPFRELRTLFRKLQALNPDWVDKHTEQIMADSALSDSRHGGKAARGRLLSLRLDPIKPCNRGRHVQEEGVVSAMREALRSGSPRRALSIYHRAVHTKMPFSQRALQLAVQAHLASSPNDLHGAYTLLRKAQTKGEDINPIINSLLARQLSTITTSSLTNPSETEALIQETLNHYHRVGIQLTETSLHRAATLCLAAGHFRGAVRYAHAAADARGPGCGPCFNLANFKILLAAYAELVDADGLRDTVTRALASPYREEAACRQALRLARARIGRSSPANSAQAAGISQAEWLRARDAVEEGISKVVEARKKLREEGRRLEVEAIRIMRRAAADAGRAEVDFDEVPWLGGKKKMRDTGAAGDDFGEVVAVMTEGNSGEMPAWLEGKSNSSITRVGVGGKRNKAGVVVGEAEGDGEGDEFLGGGFYADLERALLESSSGTAVEAF
ncbi:hypothetical protein P885DRAFT_28583 [Corynascus similis CBS 632.67]